MDSYVLKRSVGAYSGGTRVDIVDFGEGSTTVKVIGTGAELEVDASDLTKRRVREGTVTTPTREERRAASKW